MNLRSQTIRLAHAKPELREHLLPILKQSSTKIPRNLGLQEARVLREKLLASLSKDEFRLIQWLADEGGRTLFGSLKGGAAVLSVQGRKKKPEWVREETAGTIAANLVRNGWMRLSPGPDGENGYFWLTSAAESFWRSLQEEKGKTLPRP